MPYISNEKRNELISKLTKSNRFRIFFTCLAFFIWIFIGVFLLISQYLYDKNATKFWYFSLSNIPSPYTHEYHINRGCPISLFSIICIIFFIIVFIMSICSGVFLVTSKSPLYIFNVASEIAASEKRRNVSSKKNTQIIKATSSTNLEQAILESATRRIVAEELNRTNPLTNSIDDVIAAETAKTILKKVKNK